MLSYVVVLSCYVESLKGRMHHRLLS